MSTHTATITWNRHNATFTDSRYSRAHTWQFDGGVTVPASSSPHVVPIPYSDASNVDPEEAFVAALSSCHMLGFLFLAAKQGLIVDQYIDQVAGTMGKNDTGREAVTSVTLSPHIVFSGDKTPQESDVDALHHEAHELCFLANSVKTIIEVRGSWAVPSGA